MPAFKFVRNTLLLPALTLTMAGCFKPQGRNAQELERWQKADSRNASWLADSLAGRSSVSKVHPTFKTPEAKLYNFSVCVSDRRTRDPLAGHEFVVRTLDSGADKDVKADAQGCLNWSEELTFEYFADAKYLPFSFTAAPRSGHSGEREMKFAVNPWSEGGDEIVDLSRKTLPQDQLALGAQAQALLANADLSRPIAIEDLNIDIQRPTSGDARLKIQFAPMVWRKDAEGKAQALALKEGRFSVRAKLLAVPGAGRPVLLEELSERFVEMRSGLATAAFKLKALARPVDGRIDLHLDVVPVGGPKALSRFIGTFRLGGVDALSGNRQLAVKPETQTPPSAGAELPTAPAALGRNDTGVSVSNAAGKGARLLPAAAFEISRLTGRHERFVEESAISRTSEFSVTTCVTDPNDQGKRQRNRIFTVSSDSGLSVKLEADQDGCIEWRDRISHDYYQPERLTLRGYTVSGPNGTASRTAVLNPWEEASYGYFVQDLEKVGEKVVQEIAARKRMPSRLILPDASFQTGETLQSTDEYLSLRVHRKFILRLEPRVLRPSLRRGENNVEPLRKGVYLLKAVLQRDLREGQSPIESISGVKKLVQVVDGRVITPVEFVFRDLRVLSVRNQFVVELAPVDPAQVTTEAVPKALDASRDLNELVAKASGLESRSFLGPLVPGERSGSASLRPTDDLEEAYCRAIDCDQLKGGDRRAERDPELNRFYGGVKHMAAQTATGLLLRAQVLEKKYRERMGKMTHLSEFARRHNVEYVALHNERDLSGADGTLGEHNRVLKMPGAGAGWLRALGRELPKRYPFSRYKATSVDRAAVSRWLDGGAVSAGESARLCAWWMRDFLPSLAPQGKFFASKGYELLMSDRCANAYRSGRSGIFGYFRKDRAEPFLIERKLRVFEVRESEFTSGWKLDYQVSSLFALASSESRTRSSTLSASPLAPLKLIPSKVFTSVLSAFDWTLSLTRASGQSVTQSTAAGSEMNLRIEIAEGLLRIGRHEKCGLIRLNPAFLADLRTDVLFARELALEARADILSRGVFVCKGVVESAPLEAVERYYYISTPDYDSFQNDSQEARNRPWMLALRGRGDFERFIYALEARPAHGPDDVMERVNSDSGATEQISAAFRSTLPTYPGFYSWWPGEMLGKQPAGAAQRK